MIRDLFYLGIRVYVGTQWLKSASAKLHDPKWISTGEEVTRFWERAVAVPPPPARPPIAFGWYRDLLKWMIQAGSPRLVARALVVGQLASGLGLVLGIQPRKAAAIGIAENMSFSLAGSSGHNPIMLVAQELVMLAPDDVARIGIEGWLGRRT